MNINPQTSEYADLNRKAREWTIELETTVDPWLVAASVIFCASEIVRARIPGSYMERLNLIAEKVYRSRRKSYWGKKVRGTHGDDYLHRFMQHWLTALLHDDGSPLAEKLPREFYWPREVWQNRFASQIPFYHSYSYRHPSTRPSRKRSLKKRPLPFVSRANSAFADNMA